MTLTAATTELTKILARETWLQAVSTSGAEIVVYCTAKPGRDAPREYEGFAIRYVVVGAVRVTGVRRTRSGRWVHRERE